MNIIIFPADRSADATQGNREHAGGNPMPAGPRVRLSLADKVFEALSRIWSGTIEEVADELGAMGEPMDLERVKGQLYALRRRGFAAWTAGRWRHAWNVDGQARGGKLPAWADDLGVPEVYPGPWGVLLIIHRRNAVDGTMGPTRERLAVDARWLPQLIKELQAADASLQSSRPIGGDQ